VATRRTDLLGLLATAGPLGWSPVAPGTLGALLALPLGVPLSWLPWPGRVAVLAAAVLGGTWVIDRYLGEDRTADPSEVVLDEVVGCLVTLAAVPLSAPWLLAGFVVFRVLDIGKPPPIGTIDRRWHGGLGVMADDVVAGLMGGAALAALAWLVRT